MGIKDFLKIPLENQNGLTLFNLGKTVTKEDFNGLRIAVDGFNILYKAVNSIKDPLSFNGIVTSHIKILLNIITMFIKNNNTQVWIFDGYVHPLKQKTVEKRKVKLNQSYLSDTYKILDLCNIKYYKVKKDAEFVCVELIKLNKIDVVYTTDIDVLIRGGNLLKSVDKGKYYMINYNDIIPYFGTPTKLAKVAVALGCDYSDKIKRVGPITVLKKIDIIKFSDEQQQAIDLFLEKFDWRTTIMLENKLVDKDELENVLNNLKDWLTSLNFSEKSISKYIEILS